MGEGVSIPTAFFKDGRNLVFVDDEYLKPDANGKTGTWAQEKRRGELYKYSKDGVLGIGAEKAKDLREHPTPCEELWKRKQKAKV